MGDATSAWWRKCALQAVAGLGPRRTRRVYEIDGRQRSGAALEYLASAHAPLELDGALSRHPRDGPGNHLASASGDIPEQIDDHRRHRPRRHDVGEMLVDDLVIGGVARAARAAHVWMDHRDHLAQVSHVGGPGPVPGLAAGAGAEHRVGVLSE